VGLPHGHLPTVKCVEVELRATLSVSTHNARFSSSWLCGLCPLDWYIPLCVRLLTQVIFLAVIEYDLSFPQQLQMLAVLVMVGLSPSLEYGDDLVLGLRANLAD